MTNITDTKPEPISAKPNWHYDSYFLAQLERLNLLKPKTAKPLPTEVNAEPDKRQAVKKQSPDEEE